MDFIVGAFNHDSLYTLTFEPASSSNSEASLKVIRESPAIGHHSWLALSKPKSSSGNASKSFADFGSNFSSSSNTAAEPHKSRSKTSDRFLYCTVWSDKRPCVAAYRVRHSGREIDFLNAKPVKATPGYTACSDRFVYSISGPSGEVFTIESDGSLGELVQELSFVGEEASEDHGGDSHGSFGGLRHGAHSVDLSPDGKALYVADIGRNCVWTYRIDKSVSTPRSQVQLGLDRNVWSSGGEDGKQHLELGQKFLASRPNDGPRHTWPHPNGRILYSLQEHTSMVDLYAIAEDGVTLSHVQGVKIIPSDKDAKDYWADEVRLSTVRDGSGEAPRYMYASTRGLKAETKGYVAAFALNADGTLANTVSSDPGVLRDAAANAIHVWETPTSGGLANAVEPAPSREVFGSMEYLAMTDTEEGLVVVLGFDGQEIKEVARVTLGKTDEGSHVKAATAVWL